MNSELSLQARGALAYFRENPDVEITPQAVQSLGVGIVVSYRILNELISEGYMIRHRTTDDATGQPYVKYELIQVVYCENENFTNTVNDDTILSTS